MLARLLPEIRGPQTRFTSPASPSAGCSLVILITTETGVHLGQGGRGLGPPTRGWRPVGYCFFPDSGPVSTQTNAVFPQNSNHRTELCSGQVPSHRCCPPCSSRLGRAGRWMGRMLKFTPKHALAPEMPHLGPCLPRTHRRQRPCRLRRLFLLRPRGRRVFTLAAPPFHFHSLCSKAQQTPAHLALETLGGKWADGHRLWTNGRPKPGPCLSPTST